MAGTDKPKGKWGGRREGAGRKRVPATSVSGVDLEAARYGEPPEEIDSLASASALTSIAALVKQLTYGISESAKIDAAIAILDRGYGRPTTEAGGTGMLPFLGRAPVRGVANEIQDEARRHARLAVATLEKIRDNGTSEAARVRAARALLDRGLGAVVAARVPKDLERLRTDAPAATMGKKAAAADAAREAARGLYATPAPPPRLTQ